MHFLMPDIFGSHRDFREWFSNPVTGMIEGNAEYNESIIRRLHKVGILIDSCFLFSIKILETCLVTYNKPLIFVSIICSQCANLPS